MEHQYDAVVVLGCGIDENGRLGDDARSSVVAVVPLLKRQAAPLIIFSGGYSYKAGFVPPVSEAQAMKDYAVSLGLPGNQILVEAGSRDTLGNAHFTKTNLLAPLALRRVAVLGGPNHSAERLRYIFGMVLGPRYDYELLEHPGSRQSESAHEQESLKQLQGWLEGVEAGDDAAVYAVMRGQDPAYAVRP